MSKLENHSAPSPPRLLLRLFKWFCRRKLHQFIEGDLLELYEERVGEVGKRKADWRFAIDVLLLFRPSIIKPLVGNQSFNHYDMFKHHLKITWRSLLSQKLYSFINIGGLAVGLTCFILIFLYVQHELSYDKFYSNSDQIYRIYQRETGDIFQGSDYYPNTTVELAPVMREEFPEVTHVTAITEQNTLLSYGAYSFYEEGIWADADFFEVLPFKMVSGNPNTALNQAGSIVLTESLAQKVFGNKSPIGKTLVNQDSLAFTVSGVVQNPPITSSLQFSFITSFQTQAMYARELEKGNWDNNYVHTFFTLSKGADPLSVQEKLKPSIEKYRGEKHAPPFEDLYFVQPISAMHLDDMINDDIALKGNPQYVSLFTVIAILVLALACINYMNLAIARSIKRAREVGLRKVVGARKGQLIGQFIGEAILIASIALLLALGIAQLSMPFFAKWLERPIELNVIENVLLLPGLLALVIIVGVISGSYPAFFMSSLRPIQVIKGKIDSRLSGIKTQRWLIVGQYATSIVLVICSLIIYRQFQFIQEKELGYNKEHIVSIAVRDNQLYKNIDVLKNEWLKNASVLAITTSGSLPVDISSSSIINQVDTDFQENNLRVYRTPVDDDFLDVFGMELIAGRNFSTDAKSTSEEAHIFNETAVKALGMTPQEVIGKEFRGGGAKRVIGVVKDFHIHSLYMPIEPLMLTFSKRYMRYISVKVQTENIAATLAYFENSFQQFSSYPFEYKFLDDEFDQLYKADMKLGKMFGFFTFLSILIASMGLFGLAAFTAEQRTKEIGIRKVLGASVKSIVRLFSADFLLMVLLGFVIAIPIAWYAMDIWLQDFAYQIKITWWIFALAGLLAIVIAFFTVGFQSIKVALSNPVNSLRSE